MQAVNFKFRSNCSGNEQKAVLAEIQGWGEVRSAAQLKPEAKNPEVRRMAYAYLQKGAAPEEVVRKLNALDGIEVASIPAERRLVRTG
jgi:hypothetical protein